MTVQVRRAVLVGAVLASLCVVPACSPRESETQHGIAFLRHSNALNDAVAHQGTLHVGDDKCLYVTVEGVTYWAALAPGEDVDREGVTSGGTRAAFGSPTTFGRVNVDTEIPPEFRERCAGATKVYGVGL